MSGHRMTEWLPSGQGRIIMDAPGPHHIVRFTQDADGVVTGFSVTPRWYLRLLYRARRGPRRLWGVYR